MRINWPGSPSNSPDYDLPQLQQCTSCHEWKLQSEFADPVIGSSSLCSECRHRMNNLHVDLSQRWCNQCKKMKPLDNFFGQSNICTDCTFANARSYQANAADLPINYEYVLPKKKCKVCNEQKPLSEFSDRLFGKSDTCKSCMEMRTRIYSQRWCRKCQQLKDKDAFIGNSDICFSCSYRPQNVEVNLGSTQKKCCDCGLVKSISEFAAAATGESRICRECLKKYR